MKHTVLVATSISATTLYNRLLRNKPNVGMTVDETSRRNYLLVTFTPRLWIGDGWTPATLAACDAAVRLALGAEATPAPYTQATTPKRAGAACKLPRLSLSCFRPLVDREPHIRQLYAAVSARQHALLHGPPACGKTLALLCFKKLFGPLAYHCDMAAVTQCGFVKEGGKALSRGARVFLLEEIEKASPSVLRAALGLLDSRCVLERVTATAVVRHTAKVAVVATCNSLEKLARKLDGAVLSRFAIHQAWRRPSRYEAKLMLRAAGGSAAQAEVILSNLWDKHGVRDPRMLKGWLSGGDSLLDGSYVADWEAING